MISRSLLSLLFMMFAMINVAFAQNEDAMNKPNSIKNPIVKIQTSLGDIEVELYPNKAPQTVKNFLDYVHSEHYSNTLFHRVISNFMIQGGGFTTGFKQKPVNAPIKNEADNGLKNNRGTISMARTSDPDSATAQFFINLADNPFLDFRSKTPSGWGYVVFGNVISGMDVVDKIAKVRVGSFDGHGDVPVEEIFIKSVTEVSPNATPEKK